MANSLVTGKLHYNTQQQWFNRNVSMSGADGGAFNFVYLGCEGAPGSYCRGDHKVTSNIQKTPIIAEKPFISFNNNKYQLNIPDYKEYVSGHNFKDKQEVVGFEEVYVASPNDKADTINAKLATGMHVVLQPGIYNLDEALKVPGKGDNP